MTTQRRRRSFAVVATLVTLVLLAGCRGADGRPAASVSAPTPSSNASASAEGATPGADGTPAASASPAGSSPTATVAASPVPTAARTPAATAARPSPSVPVGGGAGGAGSITLAVTEPVAISGHVATPVACSTGRVYQASASDVAVQGYQFSFSVRATGYTGPGTYQTVVGMSLVEPDGTSITIPAVPGIPATISATGGTFTLSAQGTSGRTVSLALTWACSG